MSVVCPSCGRETPEGFPRCANCGAEVAAAPAPAREERKVVTVLFCDLVGFTGRAESMDPEDVRALLSGYHERVRAELERHGGTVEKFVGDAVMALFGAPIAHEDDPERAVRSALAIRDWARDERDLQVRIGITTGEALVTLGARPEAGEGMASGDVVNTASRLQAAAPENGVLVDAVTYRATRQAFDYHERGPVEAKGKADPVTGHEAVEARSRFGVDAVQTGAPLVGRERELDRLVDALASARAARTCELVTLVGVPGIGKSRLVFELSRVVDSDPELITWRQGRSLPYGEGVTFWALSEMIKAQAGILETDATINAEAKLRAGVDDALADPAEARWVDARLRPLVGLAAEADATRDRAESFTAWRRFLEALAERRPTVLVFEDLHWADDDLLDFVDHLVDWASDVPLLCVCTARPELLERRPGWGGGKPNAATLRLAPLSDDETARLLSTLLERPVLPAERQQALLARAGGNPLYAEQLARVVSERSAAEQSSLPESVHGIIAARLDALPPEEKALLAAAAVVGKVFWLGAIAHMDGADRSGLEQRLHALVRKEFVRRERRPSIAGEEEYAFRHVLVRDVAYGQIPRPLRAEKHRAAAEWIESLSPDRSADRADLLAHHYVSALDFARAARAETTVLEERAREALREAGDRAFALNSFTAAARYYERALELSPPHDEHRAILLACYGRARIALGEPSEELLEQASAAFRARGDREQAAEAEVDLSESSWLRGNREAAVRHRTRARELAGELPDSRAKARVLAVCGRQGFLAGEDEDPVPLARSALVIAERLRADGLASHALNTIGMARAGRGDPGGVEDLERSVELAKAANDPTQISRALNNLAGVLWYFGDVGRAADAIAELRRENDRFGVPAEIRWASGEEVLDLEMRGRWDDALGRADEFIAGCAESPHYLEAVCRMARSRIRLARGDRAGALEDSGRARELAAQRGDPQVVMPSLVRRARVLAWAGRRPEAAAVLDELCGQLPKFMEANWMIQLAPVLVAFGHAEIYLEHAPGLTNTPWLEAGTAIASGDWHRGADIVDSTGAIADAAEIRLSAAEALIGLGRRTEGESHLRRALHFYRSVGATGFLRQGKALLAASA